MKLKVKKLWLEALRSGKYRQVKGSLRRPNGGFCVFGVLCNLHAEAHPEIAAQQTREREYMGQTQFLPTAVAKWAGITDGAMVNAGSETHPYHATLMHLNDLSYSFEKLAGIIEKQL